MTIDVVMADHTLMHLQFSSGVTIWQHVLNWVVNTLNVHDNAL